MAVFTSISKRWRSGLTLIELLMVIVILVTVTAAVIPLAAPAIEQRRMREAARGVNTFLGAARALAIDTGRPAGVLFSASVGTAGSQASETLYLVEVPPPFAGPTVDSMVTLTRAPAQVGDLPTQSRFTAAFSPAIAGDYVRLYDTIRVNYQGVVYTIVGAASTNANGYLEGATLDLLVNLPLGSALPWPATGASSAMPYQIIRQPQKSSAQPYTLPTGAIVDMVYSGVGNSWFSNASDPYPLPANQFVGILFSPSGAIDHIAYSSGTTFTPALPVHFLVGRSENVPVTAGLENWRDLDCFWISVSSQTGQVTTEQMAATAASPGGTLVETRLFARQARGMGGK